MFLSTHALVLNPDINPEKFLEEWGNLFPQFGLEAKIPFFRLSRLFQEKDRPDLFWWNVEFFNRSSLLVWEQEIYPSLAKQLANWVQAAGTAPLASGSKSELRHSWSRGKSDFRSAFMDELSGKHFSGETEGQKRIKQSSQSKGLPPIQITANDGRIMELLLQMVGAKRGVEIGTLGGYSASWLIRGMRGTAEVSEHKLFSLELEKPRAELASQNLIAAGFREEEFQVIAGDAKKVLEENSAEWRELDFVFIDADKASYPFYLEWAVEHLKVGGLVLVDNSYLWGGMNFYPQTDLPSSLPLEWGRCETPSRTQYLAMWKTWQMLETNSRLKSVQIPTGEGLGFALKIS